MSKDREYPTESKDSQRAIKEARTMINALSEKYSLTVAKKAFFRVQREVSKKEQLVEKKKSLERELEKVKKELIK